MSQVGKEGPVSIDVGIFAHNEAAVIGMLIADLGQQTAFIDPDIDMRVLVLANGCSDDTVVVARAAVDALPAAIAACFHVRDIEEGGKSRTAHRFIHEEARATADILTFMDGDIGLPEKGTLAGMIAQMRSRPNLHAFTSRPVKDVVHNNLSVGVIGRLIAAGGDGLTDFRKSICGQLFMLRAATARQIGLPAGLPVEDGFIRAMVLTDLLTAPQDLSRIDGDPAFFHVYESIRGLGELIRHQTRIVTGSAVNAALFGLMRRKAPTKEAAHAMLMEAAEDDLWLAQALQTELPRAPFGYVPFEFLFKRLRRSGGRGLKGWIMTGLGFGLDALVYLLASVRMLRGQGAHHW